MAEDDTINTDFDTPSETPPGGPSLGGQGNTDPGPVVKAKPKRSDLQAHFYNRRGRSWPATKSAATS
jgi:hypothetical protein